MHNSETPGPPLLAEPEFCATAAPSPGQYLQATLLGAGTSVGSGLLWFFIVLVTGRFWGILAIAVGLACGLGVHRGASRHRSILLGVLAGAYTAFGLGLGYFLLFHPELFSGWLSVKPTPSPVRWFDLLFAGASILLAYRMAGPQRKDMPVN